jgi:hypothetical protein
MLTNACFQLQGIAEDYLINQVFSTLNIFFLKNAANCHSCLLISELSARRVGQCGV